MPSSTVSLSACLVAAGLIGGCQVGPDPAPTAADAASADVPAAAEPPPQTPPAASTPASPAPNRGFAALPPGAPLVYTCDDGEEVEVAYAADGAVVTLHDGRVLRLTKVQSAASAAGGGEVYAGGGASLKRDDVQLELQQDGQPTRNCHQHQT